jgi:hypothetical protein
MKTHAKEKEKPESLKNCPDENMKEEIAGFIETLAVASAELKSLKDVVPYDENEFIDIVILVQVNFNRLSRAIFLFKNLFIGF